MPLEPTRSSDLVRLRASGDCGSRCITNGTLIRCGVGRSWSPWAQPDEVSLDGADEVAFPYPRPGAGARLWRPLRPLVEYATAGAGGPMEGRPMCIRVHAARTSAACRACLALAYVWRWTSCRMSNVVPATSAGMAEDMVVLMALAGLSLRRACGVTAASTVAACPHPCRSRVCSRRWTHARHRAATRRQLGGPQRNHCSKGMLAVRWMVGCRPACRCAHHPGGRGLYATGRGYTIGGTWTGSRHDRSGAAIG